MDSVAPPLPIHPILSPAAAVALEARVLGEDPNRTWEVMRHAGRALADLVENEFPRVGVWPLQAKILTLAGGGHNGGDALLATRVLLERHPQASAVVCVAQLNERMRPLMRRALDELCAHCAGQVRFCHGPPPAPTDSVSEESYDIGLDGLLGQGFQPPVRPETAAWISWFNDLPAIALRLAIDLPSGLGHAGPVVRADLTGITGIAKDSLFAPGAAQHCGRLRYLDLDFFKTPAPEAAQGTPFLVLPTAHRILNRLRAGDLHKHRAGRVAVIGGSNGMPGALAMTCLGALHAGAGLVGAGCSASVAASLAGSLPEVLWHAWPEAEAPQAMEAAFAEITARADCVVLGPGLRCDDAWQQRLAHWIETCHLPLVLDAGALQPALLTSLRRRPIASGPVILTPHAGEYQRLQSTKPSDSLAEFSAAHRVVTLLKGPHSTLTDGQRLWYVAGGGPILSRGGSGDILAGMLGALLAQDPRDPLRSAALAVSWQTAAADHWARHRGEHAVRTTEFVAHLAPALRGEE